MFEIKEEKCAFFDKTVKDYAEKVTFLKKNILKGGNRE